MIPDTGERSWVTTPFQGKKSEGRSTDQFDFQTILVTKEFGMMRANKKKDRDVADERSPPLNIV